MEVEFSRMILRALVKKIQKLDRLFTDSFTGGGGVAGFGWIWSDWV
jgi:hypothetical protein